MFFNFGKDEKFLKIVENTNFGIHDILFFQGRDIKYQNKKIIESFTNHNKDSRGFQK